MEIKHFFNKDEMHKKEVVEGDVTRYIYTGENLQVVEYHFPPGKTFPFHSHADQEQMGYVVSGTIELTIDGKARTLKPGDWYHAPKTVEHGARTLEEATVMLDIFSPPREDLM